MGLTKEDERAGSKCLICYVPFTRSKLKRSSWDDSSFGLSSSALDKELSAMFVLRKVLEVPSERLQLFLTCLGNPELWVWVCPKCNGNVRKAMAVYEEMLKVFKKFMVLKGKIVDEIRKSCGKTPSTSGRGGEMLNLFGSKLWITDQTRHYVVTHDYGAFKNPFVSGDAQARQLMKSSSSTVLWVESKKVEIVSNSCPSSPVLLEEQDPLKIELGHDEEGYFDDALYFGQLEDESSQSNLSQCPKQLYEKMKSVYSLNPKTIIKHPEVQPCSDSTNEAENENNSEDDTAEMDADKEWVPKFLSSTTRIAKKRGSGSKLANESRFTYPCPLCSRFFFIAAQSEGLCNHLENCPGLNKSDTEGSTHELCCPICRTFKCSVLNKSQFGEHLLNCTIKDPPDPEGNAISNRIPLTRRIFECAVCPTKLYFQLNAFLKHYKHHTLKREMFKCTECLRVYPDRVAVHKHWGNCHPKLKEATAKDQQFTKEIAVPTINWWCSVCSEKFQDENERDLHVQIQHPEDVPEKVHVCSTCQKGYACADELSLHKVTLHGTVSSKAKHLVSCEICAQVCRSQLELDVHKRKKHRVNLFVCDICGTECNSQTNLENHKQLHDEVKRYQCDECSSSFTTNQYLRHHKWREHTPLDKNVNPLVCKYCDKLMHSPHYLQTHIAYSHEQKFKVFCHICGFGAIHQSRIKKHMLRAHKIGEPKIWKCPIEGCDKVFKSPRDLKSHKNKHNGTPQYSCDICGKGFYIQNQMIRHRQIHTNAESLP